MPCPLQKLDQLILPNIAVKHSIIYKDHLVLIMIETIVMLCFTITYSYVYVIRLA